MESSSTEVLHMEDIISVTSEMFSTNLTGNKVSNKPIWKKKKDKRKKYLISWLKNKRKNNYNSKKKIKYINFNNLKIKTYCKIGMN